MTTPSDSDTSAAAGMSSREAEQAATGPELYSAAAQTLDAVPASTKIAVISGASSGFGAAIARELAGQGMHVVLGARRYDRVAALAEELGGTAVPLDITDTAQVAALAGILPRVDVLVNNAGGAKGQTSVMDADIEQWRWMWETNVLGTLHMLRALMPKVVASGDGLVVTVTSVAALEAYDNGSGYTSAKHAESVLHQTLRGEFLGQPVRFCEIMPGLAETEFSLVRFDGDPEAASKPYAGLTPLVAKDIAEVVGFVASRPSHVNLDRIVIKPRAQHSAQRAHRE
ncbi:SDR family oxidoreductase [Dietzia sp.]|uniref:SDR family oxidoreductase n=1 Tax=Dietzia sp. TaxID=1871616 RepID=UPI002FDA9DBB